MGFYGNITNTSNTTFQFDRIYPNRLNMDANANNDGVFIGRYVLVEYDQKAAISNIYINTNVVIDTIDNTPCYYGYSSPNMSEAATRIKYGGTQRSEDKSVDKYYQGEFGQVQITLRDDYGTLQEAIQFYQCIGEKDGNALFVSKAKVNTTESNYIKNFAIDEDEYSKVSNGFKGYDSTVWTKVSETNESGTLITKYVNIADLNSVVPTFDIAADAPTMSPITPHFDADSTNVYYKLHAQPQWGLRVAQTDANKSDIKTQWTKVEYNPSTDVATTKYASGVINDIPVWEGDQNSKLDAAIYFNKAAFESQVGENQTADKVKKHSNTVNDNIIKIEPTGKSGNVYNAHNGKEGPTTEVQVDTQEITISLPGIGNMMSDAWDIIHGKDRNDYRGDGENTSLQGRLDAFEEIKNNQIPVKREKDGTLVGSMINHATPYVLPEGKDILSEEAINAIPENIYDGDDPWIATSINTDLLIGGQKLNENGEIAGEYDQTDNSGISIHHSFHPVLNSKTAHDKNKTSNWYSDESESNEFLQENKLPITNRETKNDDTIKLYTPYVDAKGHVVGKNIETVTLPYSFKTVKAKAQSVAVTNPNTNTNEVIADSTQDTLQFASSNKWIRMSGSNSGTGVNYDTFNIGHEVHSINETVSDQGDNETSHTNANKESGAENEINLTMYDWTYDEAGHITSKRQHTYTLPYGFKTINVGNNTTESAAPTQTGVEGETADNTQDSLTFTPTNKWIKMVATGNDEIKFGHELSGIEAKEHSSSDTDVANFGDTFNILKFITDKAGHITAVGEESIKIPSIAFTNDTTGNVVTNMNYSYNANNKTGTFTETRENIGTLTLGTHTGTTTTTNGLNILSTDTISGAFNKVQTHINSLNLASTNSDLEWITDITQANGQIAIARKGTDNLKLNSYSALSSVSSIDLATNDTLNNAFGKLEYRIKEEEKNRAAAIEALDVIDAEDDTKYVSGVSETNGKIAVLRKGTDTLKLNNYTIATVSSDVANGDTINSAFGKIQKQIKDIYGNEEIATNFDTIKEIADWLAANDSNADKIIDSIATLKGNDTVSGSVANSIKNAIEGLDSSKTADTNKYISGITITNGKISNIAQTTLPIRTVTSGTTNGTILVNGSAINVGGLKSAAYTNSSDYARANVLDTEFTYGSDKKTIQDLMNIVKAQADTIAELTARVEALEPESETPVEGE